MVLLIPSYKPLRELHIRQRIKDGREILAAVSLFPVLFRYCKRRSTKGGGGQGEEMGRREGGGINKFPCSEDDKLLLSRVGDEGRLR